MGKFFNPWLSTSESRRVCENRAASTPKRGKCFSLSPSEVEREKESAPPPGTDSGLKLNGSGGLG